MKEFIKMYNNILKSNDNQCGLETRLKYPIDNKFPYLGSGLYPVGNYYRDCWKVWHDLFVDEQHVVDGRL